ncbi:hypothetical protein GUITHDRAFT_102316 [Guillardia theta CCMP2712]|uniref:Pentacotripeptide-repeat region of PRORP domain-containing protein n=2 Tax=Guillardia theta TaxID=55529 RepID=L1JTF5_GUITC|nr:hypothetical protein GUITHDRAFT_102316 [Guillardia theta CCMP2712]EKX51712.1 hypothetical protein GUITHDRAFT_102316 [Guillardia theta CCMP2712]|eukprot:XP_005838692.1 hypothetical protein GUITHDRAFT_102316 [Guillardia theta CCMP2712]
MAGRRELLLVFMFCLWPCASPFLGLYPSAFPGTSFFNVWPIPKGLALRTKQVEAPPLSDALSWLDEDGEHLNDQTADILESFAFGDGHLEEKRSLCAKQLSDLRLNMFYPKIKQGSGQDTWGQLDAFRHILEARLHFLACLGPQVAVRQYAGGHGVKYALFWKVANQTFEKSELEQKYVNVTYLACMPLHQSISEPQWIYRLEKCSGEEWNHAFTKIQGPWNRKPAPDDPIFFCFDHFMDMVSADIRWHWPLVRNNPAVISNIFRGNFAVSRERSSLETELDSLSFDYLLWKVSQDAKKGKADLGDGKEIFQIINDAGLVPSYLSQLLLMDIVVGCARRGEAGPEEIDMALETIESLGIGSDMSMYLPALEALAWAAYHGKANMNDAEVMVLRMMESCFVSERMTELCSLPTLHSCTWSVLVSCSFKNSMDKRQYVGQAAPGLKSSYIQADLNWRDYEFNLIKTLECYNVSNSIIISAARMQLILAASLVGDSSLEEVETRLTEFLEPDVELEHGIGYPMVGAVVALAQQGKATLQDIQKTVAYCEVGGLQLDSLLVALWLNGTLAAYRRNEASIDDIVELFNVIFRQRVSLEQRLFNQVTDALIYGYRNLNLSTSKIELIKSQLLVIGGTFDKSFFDFFFEVALEEHLNRNVTVSCLDAECIVEDMMIAGHEPDTLTLTQLMKIFTVVCSESRGSIEDVARILDKAKASGVHFDSALLIQTMHAVCQCAKHGQISLEQTVSLMLYLSNEEAVTGSAELLGALIEVASAAAPFGLAHMNQLIPFVDRLVQLKGELSKHQKQLLMSILEANAHQGLASLSDADLSMKYIEGGGERPTKEMLSVLLDVVVSGAGRGQAAMKDGEHVIGRMRGCGFEIGERELERLLLIAKFSVQANVGNFSDSCKAAEALQRKIGNLSSKHAVWILESAVWGAFHRRQKNEGSGYAGSWYNETWARVDRFLQSSNISGQHLGSKGVALCARFAYLAESKHLALRAWQFFRSIPPKSRNSLVYREMIGALGAVRNSEAALGLLKVAIKNGIPLTGEMYMTTYEACSYDPAVVQELQDEYRDKVESAKREAPTQQLRTSRHRPEAEDVLLSHNQESK